MTELDLTTTTHETLPQVEARTRTRWEREHVFARTLSARAQGRPWVFYEGPPTANGMPGLHHALARTYKDVFARHRTMLGFKVERKGGWDCHGLPVELETQRQLGLRSKSDVQSYGVAAFNAAARECAERYVREFDEFTHALGFWLDTENAYRTMDDDYVESVWWSLQKTHERGLLYHDQRVCAHCCACDTTLSSHELDQGYKDVDVVSTYVAFPLEGSADTESLLAWTTTPWTLPANLLLAVDPALTYVRVRYHGQTLLLAEDACVRSLGENAEVLETLPGSQLLGRRYQPPFAVLSGESTEGDGAFTVVAADFVDGDTGTGVVHVAPAHGENDYALAKDLRVRVRTCVSARGHYDDNPALCDLAGVDALAAEHDVLTYLRERNLLVRTQKLKHRYPHCWRCQTPLMYMPKPAWYARTTAVRERMRELSKSVHWRPQSKRFDDWLANNVDWALSRERFWGTPLPFWVCDRQHMHCVGSRAELTQLSGRAVKGMHLPEVDEHVFTCTHAGCHLLMRRTPEVLDVWWDSGAMPFAQHHAPFENAERFQEEFPAAFVCEGLDQTRGWFYSLLAVSTLCFDSAPYENVLCLGLVADKSGQKMSKARGNAVDPKQLFAEFGADACRWYYLSANTPWEGYPFGVEDVRASAAVLNTLLHVARFYRAHAGNRPQPQASAPTDPLDLWLLSRLDDVTQSVAVDLRNYDANAAVATLNTFLDDLSNWYLRRSRPRFWRGDAQALATLQQTLQTLARLMAPLTPFVAEECWELSSSETAEKDSVHLQDYPSASGAWRDQRVEAAMTLVRALAGLGHSLRAHHKLPLRQPLAAATVVLADANEREHVRTLSEVLRQELNVKELRVQTHAGDFAETEVRLNFAAVGPRTLSRTQELADALAVLDGVDVMSTLQEHGSLTLMGVELSPEDVRARQKARPGYDYAVNGECGLALELNRDLDLQREGLACEVVAAVRTRRRECGYSASEHVRVRVRAQDPVCEAVRAHTQMLMRETLAVEFTVDNEVEGVDCVCGDYTLSVDLQPAL